MDAIKKINLYCVVVVFLLVCATIFLLWSIRTIKEADRKHSLAHEITNSALRLNSLAFGYFLQVKEQEPFEEWNAEYTKLSGLLDPRTLVDDEKSGQVFVRIRQNILLLKTLFDDMALVGDNVETSDGTLFVKNGTNSFETLFVKKDQLNQLSNLYLEISSDAVSLTEIGREELTKSVRLVVVLGLTCFLAILLIGLFGARLLIKNISNKNKGTPVEDIRRIKLK